MKVKFFEIEVTHGKIKQWFPEIEAKIGRRLPIHSGPLEGGVWPDKNNVMQCWPGPHYYLCIPSEFISLLEPYGEILGCIEKEVDESTVNENYEIYYWGPGCDPKLTPENKKK